MHDAPLPTQQVVQVMKVPSGLKTVVVVQRENAETGNSAIAVTATIEIIRVFISSS